MTKPVQRAMGPPQFSCCVGRTSISFTAIRGGREEPAVARRPATEEL
jgi:hypothetical protein